VHDCGAAPFSEQRNVAVGSGDENVNVAVRELVSAGGCPVTVVAGGVRSTVHV
jgi:adenine deaminase